MMRPGQNRHQAQASQLAAKWAKAATDAGKLAASTDGLDATTKQKTAQALAAMRQALKHAR